MHSDLERKENWSQIFFSRILAECWHRFPLSHCSRLQFTALRIAEAVFPTFSLLCSGDWFIVNCPLLKVMFCFVFIVSWKSKPVNPCAPGLIVASLEVKLQWLQLFFLPIVNSNWEPGQTLRHHLTSVYLHSLNYPCWLHARLYWHILSSWTAVLFLHLWLSAWNGDICFPFVYAEQAVISQLVPWGCHFSKRVYKNATIKDRGRAWRDRVVPAVAYNSEEWLSHGLPTAEDSSLLMDNHCLHCISSISGGNLSQNMFRDCVTCVSRYTGMCVI